MHNDYPYSQIIDAIYGLFASGHVVAIGSSFGKDSSCLCALAMSAAIRAQQDGLNPVMVCTTADTLIDNPVVTPYAKRELRKFAHYAKQHGIDVTVEVVEPTFLGSFFGRILTGVTIPSFPGQSQCSTDYKVTPQKSARGRIRNELAKRLPHLKLGTGQTNEIVQLTGVRITESVTRANHIAERNESATEPVRHKDGYLIMAPIMHLTDDDVWMFLLEHRDGVRKSYSDFVETDAIYSAAGGGSTCGYLADKAYIEALGKAPEKKGGCGARFGCSLCLAVGNDHSAETMIAGNPEQYSFLLGINRLREYLKNSRWDWSLRNWIGRTISDDMTIIVEPDTYSPAMVLSIFRMMCSLDLDERRATKALGIEPRFQFITPKRAFLLDLYWSMAGYHPFGTATNEYEQIASGKAYWEIPTIEPVERTPYTSGKIRVPERWARHLFSGLRSMELEIATFDTEAKSGCGTLKATSTASIPDITESGSFDVDMEALEDAMQFMADDIADLHGKYTAAYRFFAHLGTISVNTTTALEHDAMMARTQWREAMGIVGPQDYLNILALCEPGSLSQQGTTPKATPKAKTIPLKLIDGNTKPTPARTWIQQDLFADSLAAA